MNKTILCMTAAFLLMCCALIDDAYPVFSPVAVAHAEADGPALKLKKAAKLHADPAGQSPVLEIVYANDIGVWLDKVGVWVQVRMKKNGRVGWIHYSYLKPAVRTSSAPSSF